MLVSVIIPVFNGSDFVEETVRSVASQTYSDIEIILIDDCSTDSSITVLRLLEERYLNVKVITNRKNMGLPKTCNLGFSMSSGSKVIILGQDDILEPRHVEVLQKKFEDDTSFCFVNSRYIDEKGVVGDFVYSSKTLLKKSKSVHHWLIKSNFIPSTGLMIDAATFKDVGGYTEDYGHWMEWLMWVRLASKGNVVFCDEILANYRRHSNNLSGTFTDSKVYLSLLPFYIKCIREAYSSCDSKVRSLPLLVASISVRLLRLLKVHFKKWERN